MIKNDIQKKITKDQIERLEKILEIQKTSKAKMNTRIYRAMVAGIKSQIQDLKDELKEYEEKQC